MRFPPVEHLQLTTALTPSEVVARLSEQVEPSGVLRWLTTKRPYQGRVETNRFAISRVIYQRNSFLPLIRGEIVPTGTGSRLNITMRLHGGVLGVLFVLGLFFSSVILVMAIATALQGVPVILGAVMPVGLTLLVVVAGNAAFAKEARLGRDFLVAQLAAEEVPTTEWPALSAPLESVGPRPR